jgi:hypothetical protein
MTTNNASIITATATATANALWTCITSTHELASSIALLCNANGENYKEAGASLRVAWDEIGYDVLPSQATRTLVEACFQTNMERKSASQFLNAMGLVTKQRISQLLSVVFDGDKSKNNNNGKADKKSQEGLDKPNGNGFTFEQILASLQSLDKLTMEQAQILASVAASKIA